MIHRARKKAGRNADIYGIFTDSYKWAFAHIDNKSRVRLPSTQQVGRLKYLICIVYISGFALDTQVNKIMDQAAILAATATLVSARDQLERVDSLQNLRYTR